MKPLLTFLAALLLSPAADAQAPYWNETPSGTSKNLLSIDFGNAKAGYIGGKDSTLLRTLDGGVTWTKLTPTGLSFSAASPDIVHVNFVSAGTGYAIVSNHAFPEFKGTLYRTTDSGRSWMSVFGAAAAARSFFFDVNNGFVVGSAFFSGHTVSKQTAGAWGNPKSLGGHSGDFLYGIDFRNNSTGIVGGTGGFVYRTFNGGVSWDTVKTVSDTTITDIVYLSPGRILATTDNPVGPVIISHDSGRTWDTETSTMTFYYPVMKGLTASKKDSFISVGHTSLNSDGLIFWHNGGNINLQTADHPLNDVSMRDDSIAYIVGENGLILTNRIPGLGVGPRSKAQMPLLFPNPARTSLQTTAAFAHTVAIYDAGGKLVARSGQMAGSHQISTAHLNRGLYFVSCTTADGESMMQKLLID